jgi:hypothetical protein
MCLLTGVAACAQLYSSRSQPQGRCVRQNCSRIQHCIVLCWFAEPAYCPCMSRTKSQFESTSTASNSACTAAAACPSPNFLALHAGFCRIGMLLCVCSCYGHASKRLAAVCVSGSVLAPQRRRCMCSYAVCGATEVHSHMDVREGCPASLLLYNFCCGSSTGWKRVYPWFCVTSYPAHPHQCV